jgi:Kef-type K+ transport system membrane component KefB
VQFLIAFFIIFVISYIAGMLDLIAVGIIGAYFAGTLMQKTKDKASAEVCSSLKSVSYGIFVPIFFAWVGLSVNLNIMPSYLWQALTICGFALAVKIVAVFFVSKWENFSWKESLIYGIGTSARGNDGLVVLMIATTTPSLVKTSQLFIAALVILIVVSLIFSSISLKKLVK